MTKNCKHCGASHWKKLFTSFKSHGRFLVDENENFDIVRCENCGNVFVGDIDVNVKYYSKYYTEDYYSFDEQLRDINKLLLFFIKKSWQFSFKRKEAAILSYFNEKNSKLKILDFGCGIGYFLNNLKSSRFIKTGQEINIYGYNKCKKLEFKVYTNDLLKIGLRSGEFDVVSMWHVLEHLDDPKKYLNKISLILKKDGILIFSTPNTDSLGFKIGKANWFHLDSPRHLTLYNKKSLIKLCNDAGFEVVSIKNEFYDYYLDLFWSLRKSHFKYFFYITYPFWKIISKETLTFVCKKNVDRKSC